MSPSPATTSEKGTWMSDLKIDDMAFDLDPSNDITNPLHHVDGGPAHKDSTPQQLSIMKQMMMAVGVSSFRPDFSQAPT